MKFPLHLSLALLSFALPLAAQAQEAAPALAAQELAISKPGDLELSCGALSQEAQLMRYIIAATQDIQDETDMHRKGLKAAGALGSMLIGTATGGIGLAAAGLLAGMPIDNRADSAHDVQTIAKQRSTFVMGIYNAKGCFGPFNYRPIDIAAETEEDKRADEDYASIEPVASEQVFRFNN